MRLPCIFLDNTPLEMLDDIKYLGIFLTSDFHDNTDVQREMRAIYARGNAIIKKFKSCSVDVKLCHLEIKKLSSLSHIK
jgi:hypothetical protein